MFGIARVFFLWALASVFSAPALAQFNGCRSGFCSAGSAGTPPAGYQGAGDVAGAAALVWGSCARAYNAAYANGTNPMCDLQDVLTGTVAICTLRVATTGFVDLAGAYCTGGLTPDVACAAAAGGACIISRIYNQVSPGTLDLTQSTLANKPGIVFGDINGLPTVDCGRTATSQLVTAATITQAQPISVSAAFIRTGNFTTQQGFAGGSGEPSVGSAVTANSAQGRAGSVIAFAAADNTWHGLTALFNGAGGAYNINGSDVASQNFGAVGMTTASFRICRAGALQPVGRIAEGGIWAASISRSAVYTNQHGANGYNGAF